MGGFFQPIFFAETFPSGLFPQLPSDPISVPSAAIRSFNRPTDLQGWTCF
jgi:hypothetical protein